MKAKELHENFINLGNKYVRRIISKIKMDKKFNSLKTEYLKGLEKVNSNTNSPSFSLFTTSTDVNELQTYYNERIEEQNSLIQIQSAFNQLVKKAEEEGYRFYGCNSTTAIKYYEKEISESINTTFDKRTYEKCFELHNQLSQENDYFTPFKNILSTPLEEFQEWEENAFPYHCLNHEQREFIDRSFGIQMKYLIKKGKLITPETKKFRKLFSEPKDIIPISNEDNESPEYKEFKDRTALLFELGIIDFLKTSNNDPNITNGKIAKVLSKITGIKESTLRKYINSSCNRDYSSDDVYTGKTINKAKDYLINIGYEIKK